ncbi:hypothetical protein [Hyphobacterium sp.]
MWAAGNEHLARAEPRTHFRTDRRRAAVAVRARHSTLPR